MTIRTNLSWMSKASAYWSSGWANRASPALSFWRTRARALPSPTPSRKKNCPTRFRCCSTAASGSRPDYHGERTFKEQELIVISPGVPFDVPQLVQARQAGIPVIGEVELAARYLKGNIVAITGSNGKTTTTSLAGEIIAAGGRQTLVGGNIGTPAISFVGERDRRFLDRARGQQLSVGNHRRPFIPRSPSC